MTARTQHTPHWTVCDAENSPSLMLSQPAAFFVKVSNLDVAAIVLMPAFENPAGKIAEQRARRIVACVNWCEGQITTEEINAGAMKYGQLERFHRAAITERDSLRAENARLREALGKVCEALFHDAVNGHLNDAQIITRDGIGEVYETARIALKPAA